MLIDSILSLGFPVRCPECTSHIERRSDGAACAGCWNETRIFHGNETLCAKCSAILSFVSRPVATWCRMCDGHSFDRARAVGVYERALSASVIRLKTVPVVGTRLSELLSEAFFRAGFYDADLIVPVPLSAKRMIERGFNQAEVIARSFAGGVGVPVDGRSLQRKVDTPFHRAGMDRKAREATVADAFEVKRPRLISGRKVLLVDDVFTTGATASHCAAALKSAGAARVDVLTIARVWKGG